ncbi:MAG: hypothetical protein SYR96_32730 [Actinomycetota bacterium]|nr:hypothetical protein [Actinomycetota bacterium]
MTPDELMQAALETAEQGMTHGELPIGRYAEAGPDTAFRRWSRHLAEADQPERTP